MGRTRTKQKKLPYAADSSDDATAKSEPPLEALLEKAQDLLVQCDFELAGRFVDRVLQRSPHHAEAKEILGVVQLELGNVEDARQLSDEDPHAALGYYSAAVDLLVAQLKGKAPAGVSDVESEEHETRRTIVRALIGQVEIWMDPEYDLCFDPDAEKTCEALLVRSLETDPGNAEALQALASVRMSQQRPDDARALLGQAWGKWKDLETDDVRMPPLPVRRALAKLFLELALYEPAIAVLQDVIAADDEDVEAWYLEGLAHFLTAQQAHQAGVQDWQERARDARDALESCLVLHAAQEHPDFPLRNHAREMVSQLEAMGITPSLDDEGDGGEGWEDAGESSSDGDIDMV
ncbi:TPR-like protein [Vararia minispora EC-137]|uniref:TPR-like protein n=1 Tax=Vararia minispora EC-137 TaxID=1314806 RepID=A0ACB8QMW8_9AGAM|nr:TPR-like protein [Vararia minispora EC-137]